MNRKCMSDIALKWLLIKIFLTLAEAHAKYLLFVGTTLRVSKSRFVQNV